MKKNFIYIFAGLFSVSSAFGVEKVFYSSLPSNEKIIALTFDDGPGPQTREFLDLLDREQVKATFFFLGELVQFRGAMAKEALDRGHEVASHTYYHTNYNQKLKKKMADFHETKENRPKSISETKKDLAIDMEKTRLVIEKAISKPIKFCRMPYGIDGPWIHEVAKEKGFILVNWTYGADWTPSSAEQLIPSYIKAIQPGAILLLHDGGVKREKTLKITEAVIKAAKEKGFRFVTVRELLENR